MARILLGVSGGIAAYKAVELVRLATAAGHAVRVVQTPASLQFVGRATFEGVTGAPVLVDEFEPDPARGAFPGDPAPDHDPISHLELVARCDVFVVAPASANTLAKLAQRAGRQPAHQRRAGEHRAARGRAGDEQPHVRAPGHAGEPRAAALARRAHRGARHGPARLEGRVGGGPPGRAARDPGGRRGGAARRVRPALARRAARARHRRRHARADRLGALRRATARRAGWAWRWPRRPPGAAPT